MDETALLQMLESGQVGGAALDVFTSEPPQEHLRALIAHPNLVCTPHLGASTDEAQINVARDIATQMCDVFDQKDYFGVMNVSYLAASTQTHMKPFMRLAETIGAMQAQLSSSRVTKVVLKTMGGRDANITTRQARQLLEAQVLKGLLKHQGQGQLSPDMISAPAMAKEAGVEAVSSPEVYSYLIHVFSLTAAVVGFCTQMIAEEAPELTGGQFWNLLSVEATREDGTTAKVTGAVFGNQPHIVQVSCTVGISLGL